MNKACVVFSFPVTEQSIDDVGEIVKKAKTLFEDMPDVKIGAATRESAEIILSVFSKEPETSNEATEN